MHRGIWILAALAVCGSVNRVATTADDQAQPDKETTKDDARSLKRLEVFKKAVKNLTVKSAVIQDEARLTFPDAPILRYNDVTRHFFDAAVWKLGTHGRPTALLTLEMYGNGQGSALLMHEFTSLADQPFSVDTPLGIHWQPSDTDAQFKPLEKAPEPAATAPLRLTQMRALARRFSCGEELGGNKQQLRLLSQPLDRYDDADAGVIDGAVFALATGTNPELIVLIEARADGWKYALARQAIATLDVSLDDLPLSTFPRFQGEGSENDYFSQPYNVHFDWE